MSQNIVDEVARVLYYNIIDIFMQQQDTSQQHRAFGYEGTGEMIYKQKWYQLQAYISSAFRMWFTIKMREWKFPSYINSNRVLRRHT